MRVDKVLKSLLIVGCAALFPAVMPQSFCQGHEGREEARDQRYEEIIKELDLSSEQQAQISGQRAAEKAFSKEMREKMRLLRGELSKELDKPVTDEQAVRLLVSRMKELFGERLQRKMEGILTMKKILTPEQFKMLQDKTKTYDKKGGKP